MSSVAETKKEEASPSKDSHFVAVYIWSSDLYSQPIIAGHASLFVNQPETYLSFWPGEHGASRGDPVKARFIKNLADDIAAEAQERGSADGTPDGIYKIVINADKASEMALFIQDKQKNVDKLKYVLVNRGNETDFNCSGMVELALHQVLGISCGDDASPSLPHRISFKLNEIAQSPQLNVIIIHESESLKSVIKEQQQSYRSNL